MSFVVTINSKRLFFKNFITTVVATVIAIAISDFSFFIITLFLKSIPLFEGFIVSTIIPCIAAPILSYFILKSRNKLMLLSKELKITREKAEKTLKARDIFMANISHELRTPLTHIIGFSELLASGKIGDLTAEQLEYINIVLESSKHLLSIVNELLDFSKIEAGKISLNLSKVDINSILERILNPIIRDAKNKNIKVILNIEQVEKPMIADEKRLEEVFYNLLSNAIKFTPEKGIITVNLKSIKDKNEKNSIHFIVQDTGIGIKKENMKLIFEPFEQIESGISRKYKGTGLGLAITKKIVEIHGGKIWVESKGEGRGSSFHIIFPIE